MISYELAWQLRDAGLEWHPAEHDRFVLPGRDLDAQIFVVSALPALVQRYNGHAVVTFHASVEWALDYVMLAEALWLPYESQLREALAARLPDGSPLGLQRTPSGNYACTVGAGPTSQSYSGPDADTAYGQALLAILVATS